MSRDTKSKKPARLYQARFDETFTPTLSLEVTPVGFTGLLFESREGRRPSVSAGSRFVREVVEEVVIRSVNDAAQYLLEKVYAPFEEFDQEELWVLLLNNKNQVTHETMVYRGTVNSIELRPSELFKEAVRVNAPSIIVSHCHPSGSPEPSSEDIEITRVVNEAAKLLHIEVLDHIIVGNARWISLKEMKVL